MPLACMMFDGSTGVPSRMQHFACHDGFLIFRNLLKLSPFCQIKSTEKFCALCERPFGESCAHRIVLLAMSEVRNSREGFSVWIEQRKKRLSNALAQEDLYGGDIYGERAPSPDAYPVSSLRAGRPAQVCLIIKRGYFIWNLHSVFFVGSLRSNKYQN